MADVPEIYMQEFWATAKLHQHSIRFKMDTKKHVLDLEAFREMLHISPRILGQPFDEFPFKEEILEFLRFLGHSTQIKTLTDVNVNKLYQPWRSFTAVINKCLTGKSSSIDSLRISQAQILWGLYHGSNAFLVTADVPEIYMQEFWATTKLHHNSIRFKMDTNKSVLDLEAFREMLHISPRIPSQSFAELPFEEEILEFLRHLRHSDEIRHLTNVNVIRCDTTD
nr:hypothetical protein [Tanacetum cinerariifolium]